LLTLFLAMASAQDVAMSIEEFLDDEISLEELEDWSAFSLQEALAGQDAHGRAAALFLRSILNAYAEDQSDLGLRTALEKAVRPAALRAERMRAMDLRERSNRAVIAKAAVALLLLSPGTLPELPQGHNVTRAIDGALDAQTASSRVLEPPVELVEV
jgi:hypothetical protein